jgi:hypothetical protein
MHIYIYVARHIYTCLHRGITSNSYTYAPMYTVTYHMYQHIHTRIDSNVHVRSANFTDLFYVLQMARVSISNRDLFVAVAVLVALDGSVLGGWQASSPLAWDRKTIEVDSFNRTLESLGRCIDTGDGGLDSTGFLVMVAVSLSSRKCIICIHLYVCTFLYICLCVYILSLPHTSINITSWILCHIYVFKIPEHRHIYPSANISITFYCHRYCTQFY